MHAGFGWGNVREREHLEGLCVYVHGRVILNWIFKKWEGGIDRIDPAQDKERWWTLLNVVVNLQVP